MFIHTETLDAFAGHGVGGRLVKAVLDQARDRSLRVVPRCPFVALHRRAPRVSRPRGLSCRRAAGAEFDARWAIDGCGEWHVGCPHDAVFPVCTSIWLTATMRRSHQHETGSTPDSGLTFMKPWASYTSGDRAYRRCRLAVIGDGIPFCKRVDRPRWCKRSDENGGSDASLERVTHFGCARYDRRDKTERDPAPEPLIRGMPYPLERPSMQVLRRRQGRRR